mmetsp:Transcript_67766/g.171999  ORF Transcript_67766/g.171999 Transcript_67766/m.171999 type:complete len:265 (+) Transcript_67766:112-906(+)
MVCLKSCSLKSELFEPLLLPEEELDEAPPVLAFLAFLPGGAAPFLACCLACLPFFLASLSAFLAALSFCTFWPSVVPLAPLSFSQASSFTAPSPTSVAPSLLATGNPAAATSLVAVAVAGARLSSSSVSQPSKAPRAAAAAAAFWCSGWPSRPPTAMRTKSRRYTPSSEAPTPRATAPSGSRACSNGCTVFSRGAACPSRRARSSSLQRHSRRRMPPPAPRAEEAAARAVATFSPCSPVRTLRTVPTSCVPTLDPSNTTMSPFL